MKTIKASLSAETLERVENMATRLAKIQEELAEILSEVRVVDRPPSTSYVELAEPGSDTALPRPVVAAVKFDPEQAGMRAVLAMQEAEGGAWASSELESKFGLSSAMLHRRRKEHRILYWRDARHAFHYPKWQFTPTGALLPGVQEVLQMFGSDDEWRLMSYFLGQRQQLGDRRPLDLLRAGEKETVLAHAKLHADENTW